MSGTSLSGTGINNAGAVVETNVPGTAIFAVRAGVTADAGAGNPAIDGTGSTVLTGVGLASVGDAFATNLHETQRTLVAGQAGVTNRTFTLIRTIKIRTVRMLGARIRQTLVRVHTIQTIRLVTGIAGASSHARVQINRTRAVTSASLILASINDTSAVV